MVVDEIDLSEARTRLMVDALKIGSVVLAGRSA